jgi:hypothetical protein
VIEMCDPNTTLRCLLPSTLKSSFRSPQIRIVFSAMHLM